MAILNNRYISKIINFFKRDDIYGKCYIHTVNWYSIFDEKGSDISYNDMLSLIKEKMNKKHKLYLFPHCKDIFFKQNGKVISDISLFMGEDVYILENVERMKIGRERFNAYLAYEKLIKWFKHNNSNLVSENSLNNYFL